MARASAAEAMTCASAAAVAATRCSRRDRPGGGRGLRQAKMFTAVGQRPAHNAFHAKILVACRREFSGWCPTLVFSADLAGSLTTRMSAVRVPHRPLRKSFVDTAPPKSLTTLLVQWWPECKRRSAGHGKGALGGAGNWRPLIRLLREQFGSEPANDLSPRRLRILLEETAAQRGWSLRYVRDQLTRIRTILKWGVAEELGNPSVLQ
jgi:hypothetical protein